MSAAVFVALPFLGVPLSLCTMSVALEFSSWVGILILILVGLVAGSVTRESVPNRLFLVALSAGLGLLVVGMELAIRH